MSRILHWFRRDLRVHDNTSLARAARDADEVVSVFVLDDHYGDDPNANVGPARFRFLRDSLVELDRAIAARGGRLAIVPGPAERALPGLLRETGAAGVYANFEIGPYPEKRDRAARAAVERAGGVFRLFPDALLVEPDAIATDRGDPFIVYTPFAKKWLAAQKRAPEPAPVRLAAPPLRSVPIDRVRVFRGLAPNPDGPRAGETAARELLERFLDGPAARYATDRDFPARGVTSRLSPHLHFGTLAPRTIRAAAAEAWRSGDRARRTSLDAFVRELAWREFFHHVLFHFPRVANESFRPEFDRLRWSHAPAALDAWKAGRTGYPFVDAGMRELAVTGWMHNRARMAVASFLTKDLHVHWREGEKWFERSLADADLANNNGGWQWAAGSGTDAAPYFRIFHPVTQGKRFDPDGAYVRRFVPELARVPLSKLHEPWTMTAAEQRAAGCRIAADRGGDYPPPIVDDAEERKRALALFEELKEKATV